VDLVLEAVGRQETIAASIASVRKGGTVTLIGNISPESRYLCRQSSPARIRLQGSCASSGEYPQAMELLAQRKDQSEVIDHRSRSTQGRSALVRAAACRRANLMKVVLDPSA